MHNRRRPRRVGGVMRHVRRSGHGVILVVMRHLLGVVAGGVRIHRGAVVHGVVVVVGVVVLLVIVRRLVRRLVGREMLRTAASRTVACGRHMSHLNRSSSSWYSANTTRHRLPSRQMTTVHLAGLGSIEAVASCPLLRLRFLERNNRRVFAFEGNILTKSRRWRRTGLARKKKEKSRAAGGGIGFEWCAVISKPRMSLSLVAKPWPQRVVSWKLRSRAKARCWCWLVPVPVPGPQETKRAVRHVYFFDLFSSIIQQQLRSTSGSQESNPMQLKNVYGHCIKACRTALTVGSKDTRPDVCKGGY